jgi:hypothetical protein
MNSFVDPGRWHRATHAHFRMGLGEFGGEGQYPLSWNWYSFSGWMFPPGEDPLVLVGMRLGLCLPRRFHAREADSECQE